MLAFARSAVGTVARVSDQGEVESDARQFQTRWKCLACRSRRKLNRIYELLGTADELEGFKPCDETGRRLIE